MTSVNKLSFSSITDLDDCRFRFKLKEIDKIYTFKLSIDTLFGKLIHSGVQNILQKDENPSIEIKVFNRKWRLFFKLYKKFIDKQKFVEFYKAGLNILKNCKELFTEYEVFSVEEKIEETIFDDREDVKYKGFIDIVFRHKVTGKYVIADFKTAKSAYLFKKYLSTLKKYQVAYYKHYFAKKHNILPEDIETWFVVLEKTSTSKKPVVIIPETSGPKKIQNSLQIIRKSLKIIDSGKFTKNRSVCFNPQTGIKCPFYQTQHCK